MRSVVVLWAALASFASAQLDTQLRVRIPMRDGVHLFTAVYVPKDASVAYPLVIAPSNQSPTEA